MVTCVIQGLKSITFFMFLQRKCLFTARWDIGPLSPALSDAFEFAIYE